MIVALVFGLLAWLRWGAITFAGVDRPFMCGIARYGKENLELEIDDTGAGEGTYDGEAHGLVGMRESGLVQPGEAPRESADYLQSKSAQGRTADRATAARPPP